MKIVTPATKEFPSVALATLSSGTVLIEPFSKVHEVAEWIMGHPIWTHQFPSLRHEIENAVLKQFPTMPTKLDGVTRENWREHADRIEAEFGKTVRVKRGDGLTALLPTDGIPEGKEVIIVSAGRAP